MNSNRRVHRRMIAAFVVLAASFHTGAAVAQPSRAAGCDSRIQVVNRSSSALRELYFSPPANSNWGPDRLGEYVLPSGSAKNYRPNPGGNYDFRVVWGTGEAVERRQVNICRIGRITVTNTGIRTE